MVRGIVSEHIDHTTLPDYDERQIWVDGCPNCADLARDVPFSTSSLTDDELVRATRRGVVWAYALKPSIGKVSTNELQLLHHLASAYSVMCRLSQLGYHAGSSKW